MIKALYEDNSVRDLTEDMWEKYRITPINQSNFKPIIEFKNKIFILPISVCALPFQEAVKIIKTAIKYNKDDCDETFLKEYPKNFRI